MSDLAVPSRTERYASVIDWQITCASCGLDAVHLKVKMVDLFGKVTLTSLRIILDVSFLCADVIPESALSATGCEAASALSVSMLGGDSVTLFVDERLVGSDATWTCAVDWYV